MIPKNGFFGLKGLNGAVSACIMLSNKRWLEVPSTAPVKALGHEICGLVSKCDLKTISSEARHICSALRQMLRPTVVENAATNAAPTQVCRNR